MNNIMVDLETLGNSADAAILSIGAVKFNSTGLGEEFHEFIDLQSNDAYGMKIDPSTVLWWMQQSDEARRAIHSPPKEPQRLFAVLAQFGTFIGFTDKVKIWGNGADFDNAILQTAYRKSNMDLPWKFWNNRCYRTMKGMFPKVPKPERTGTHHSALDDAKFQAEHLIKILNAIGGKK